MVCTSSLYFGSEGRDSSGLDSLTRRLARRSFSATGAMTTISVVGFFMIERPALTPFLIVFACDGSLNSTKVSAVHFPLFFKHIRNSGFLSTRRWARLRCLPDQPQNFPHYMPGPVFGKSNRLVLSIVRLQQFNAVNVPEP